MKIKDNNLAQFLAHYISENTGSKLVDEEKGKPLVAIFRDWQDGG